MATHTITMGVVGSGVTRSQKIASTAAGVNLIDGETVANGQTDFAINFDLDVSECSSFYLVSDKAVTYYSNAAKTETISLRANEPYVWHTNSYDTFLLSTDITTGILITNASGSTATIYCIALYDVTP